MSDHTGDGTIRAKWCLKTCLMICYGILMNKNKETQIFTPEWITEMMLDTLDEKLLSDPDTFFFEPSCGEGDMLVVVLDRLYENMYEHCKCKYKAVSNVLFKFYAVEIDPELVVKARIKIYTWAISKLDRAPSKLEEYLIAFIVQQDIENMDFFEAIKHGIGDSKGRRSLNKHFQWDLT